MLVLISLGLDLLTITATSTRTTEQVEMPTFTTITEVLQSSTKYPPMLNQEHFINPESISSLIETKKSPERPFSTSKMVREEIPTLCLIMEVTHSEESTKNTEKLSKNL